MIEAFPEYVFSHDRKANFNNFDAWKDPTFSIFSFSFFLFFFLKPSGELSPSLPSLWRRLCLKVYTHLHAICFGFTLDMNDRQLRTSKHNTFYLIWSGFILKISLIFLHKSLIECQVCVPACRFVNIRTGTEIGCSTSSHQSTTDLTQCVCVCFYFENCEDSIFQSVSIKPPNINRIFCHLFTLSFWEMIETLKTSHFHLAKWFVTFLSRNSNNGMQQNMISNLILQKGCVGKDFRKTILLSVAGIDLKNGRRFCINLISNAKQSNVSLNIFPWYRANGSCENYSLESGRSVSFFFLTWLNITKSSYSFGEQNMKQEASIWMFKILFALGILMKTWIDYFRNEIALYIWYHKTWQVPEMKWNLTYSNFFFFNRNIELFACFVF